MNWNSMIRAGGALAIYLALMGAYLGDVSPLVFALYSALLLCLALTLHHTGFSASVALNNDQPLQTILPSVAESMEELHVLQAEINELQAQFAAEKTAPTNPGLPDGPIG